MIYSLKDTLKQKIDVFGTITGFPLLLYPLLRELNLVLQEVGKNDHKNTDKNETILLKHVLKMLTCIVFAVLRLMVVSFRGVEVW